MIIINNLGEVFAGIMDVFINTINVVAETIATNKTIGMIIVIGLFFSILFALISLKK